MYLRDLRNFILLYPRIISVHINLGLKLIKQKVGQFGNCPTFCFISFILMIYVHSLRFVFDYIIKPTEVLKDSSALMLWHAHYVQP